jgi:hypothetical protein
MARRTIARHPTPVSPAAAIAAGTNGPSAADLLENKLEQLKSLLWCCYGDGIDWFDGAGPKHLDNVIWIAADLVSDAAALFQQCESEWSGRT